MESYKYVWASQLMLVVMNIPANAGDIRDANSILGLGRFPAGGHGNPLQCSWLEKPLNRGARWATVHWTAKSQTWLKWQYSLINMFASLLHAYSHLFIFYTFPMIHNMVKWHVGCNYTHTHSYTQGSGRIFSRISKASWIQSKSNSASNNFNKTWTPKLWYLHQLCWY